MLIVQGRSAFNIEMWSLKQIQKAQLHKRNIDITIEKVQQDGLSLLRKGDQTLQCVWKLRERRVDGKRKWLPIPLFGDRSVLI
jgi:hypothetical protein